MFKSSKSHRQQLKLLALASLVAIADAPTAEAARWRVNREVTCFEACRPLQPRLVSIRMERLPVCRVYLGRRYGWRTGHEVDAGFGMSVACVLPHGSYTKPYQCWCD